MNREDELQGIIDFQNKEIKEFEAVIMPIIKTKKNWKYYADEIGIALCCSDCPGRETGKVMTVGDIRKLSKP